jgi:hypothetical protein
MEILKRLINNTMREAYVIWTYHLPL